MISSRIPKHVAIIMDGNGRWAKKRHMPRTYGHLQGVRRVDDIVAAARIAGIQFLTLFAFSAENWNRPRQEVDVLMRTLVKNLDEKAKELHKADIKFQVLGSLDGVPEKVAAALSRAQEQTKGNSGMTLNLAFNYGSRQEILDAVKKLCREVKDGRLDLDSLNEQSISAALYTRGMPDPDLLIRTSGEQRISNFLLWQLSYSELYFTSKYWPDFTKKEFEKALADYQRRERRYGKVLEP